MNRPLKNTNADTNRPLSADWYDYPQYYDMAFRDETRREADFIEAACRKYCPFRVRRLLEPACGGGRMVVELASRGYSMSAFDLSQPALDYLRRRLERRGLRAQVMRANMARFRLSRQVDAAFNTWNSFRHLTTEEEALSHLQSVSRCLRPGGLYVLGLHLLPLDVSEECTERWIVRHGRVRLSVMLRVVWTDRQRRLERIRIRMRARTPRRDVKLESEFSFRMYTAAQFLRLLRRVPELELCDVYDFWYEIDRPLPLDDDRIDTVFVLRRRRE
jgi:SAM-dependent methyltransferase